jgi:hypothetical protein
MLPLPRGSVTVAMPVGATQNLSAPAGGPHPPIPSAARAVRTENRQLPLPAKPSMSET